MLRPSMSSGGGGEELYILTESTLLPITSVRFGNVNTTQTGSPLWCETTGTVGSIDRSRRSAISE
jgi:hypothetical protein